jgi:hypothetical protein
MKIITGWLPQLSLLGIVYELSENYDLSIKFLKMAKAIKINNRWERQY